MDMIDKKKWGEFKKKEKVLKKATEILRVEDKDLPRVIDRFRKRVLNN